MSINELFYYTNQKVKLQTAAENKLNNINSEILYSDYSKSSNNFLKDISFIPFGEKNESNAEIDINIDEAVEKLADLDKQENLMQLYIDTLFEDESRVSDYSASSCFTEDSRIKIDDYGNSYVTVEEMGVYSDTNDSINSIISNSYNINTLEVNGYTREDITDLIIRENHLKNIDDIKVGQEILLPSFDIPDGNEDSVETDEDGNTIHSYIDENGVLKSNVTDENGRIIQESSFDEDCNLESTVSYEYDDEGNVSSKLQTLYDKNGNIISEENI